MALFPHDVGVSGGAAAATTTRAKQACYSCRKQKRKCDKALPSCGLCSRMARDCDSEALAALQVKLVELENRLNYNGGPDVSLSHLSPGSASATMSHSETGTQLLSREPLWQGGPNTFPVASFLDSRMFRGSGLQIPKPTSDVPTDIVQCIGTADDFEQTLSDFFGDIYPWFPIISKKRVTLGYQWWIAGGDVALLLLAMKLITSQPQKGYTAAENYLYTAAKRQATHLEGLGTTSLEFLQALVLLALYEYGQGVYPAAYMTTGQCIRYSEYLELSSPSDSNAVLGPLLSWVELEERRRVWWAVYILDKLVSLGSYKRPMCPEPYPNDLLPTNDKAWELGDTGAAFQRPVSAPFSDVQSTFARLCQAALLAARTLRHHASLERRKATGERFDFGEVASVSEHVHILSKALQTDLTANPANYFSLVAARSLNYISILKILSLYASGESLRGVGSEWNEEEMALQLTALDGVKKVVSHLVGFAVDLLTFIALDEDVVKTPPMVLDPIYLAALTQHSTLKEMGDPVAEASLETMKKCLLRLSGRWRLGKELLDMYELHEMHYIVTPNLSSSRLGGIPLVIPGMS
ncbi:fungal-specific transcription factor domain-containing protein [Xylariales sp. PMI_506]|nr:fungal-specific transcription factor domain-containing protein [Xylariales sp. PMI_506]